MHDARHCHCLGVMCVIVFAACMQLPDTHPDNYDPQGFNLWPEGQPEFK